MEDRCLHSLLKGCHANLLPGSPHVGDHDSLAGPTQRVLQQSGQLAVTVGDKHRLALHEGEGLRAMSQGSQLQWGKMLSQHSTHC